MQMLVRTQRSREGRLPHGALIVAGSETNNRLFKCHSLHFHVCFFLMDEENERFPCPYTSRLFFYIKVLSEKKEMYFFVNYG